MCTKTHDAKLNTDLFLLSGLCVDSPSAHLVIIVPLNSNEDFRDNEDILLIILEKVMGSVSLLSVIISDHFNALPKASDRSLPSGFFALLTPTSCLIS